MDMDRTIHEQVVEDLYTEALALADEARAVFDLREDARQSIVSDHVRMAVSVEGLRTTTRVMHSLAWLLNQRAYHAGELTKLQMLRHGGLGDERPSDPDNMELLEPATRALIRDTERLHERIKRLDEEQRQIGEASDPVRDMQGRIAAAFASS